MPVPFFVAHFFLVAYLFCGLVAPVINCYWFAFVNRLLFSMAALIVEDFKQWLFFFTVWGSVLG